MGTVEVENSLNTLRLKSLIQLIWTIPQNSRFGVLVVSAKKFIYMKVGCAFKTAWTIPENNALVLEASNEV